MGMLFAVGGAVVVGDWACARFGWPGLVGGVLLGLAGGWVGGIAAVALPLFLCAWGERLRHRWALWQYFGRYWSRRRTSGWDALTRTLAVGAPVSGRVVRGFYHGVIVGGSGPAGVAALASRSGIAAHRLLTS
jgi:hypothetical protein